jgi:two-component system nitrate/nitrite response regulator NarL
MSDAKWNSTPLENDGPIHSLTPVTTGEVDAKKSIAAEDFKSAARSSSHLSPIALIGSTVLFREGLTRILGAEGFQIVGSAASLDEALLNLLAQHRSVSLIISVGDVPEATWRQIELFKKMAQSGRIIVLGGRSHWCDITRAFRAGANAYFTDVANCDAFVKFLELVMLGETFLPPEILPLILGHEDQAITPDVGYEDLAVAHDINANAENANAEASIVTTPFYLMHLTDQEKRVLRCLVEGDANKVIARKIGAAEATVKVYVKAILRKIRVQNRTQAAIWAVNNTPFVAVNVNGSASAAALLH